jgi:RND family efflux transporter MFP subunit
MRMKKIIKWIVGILVVVGIAGFAARTIAARKAEKAAIELALAKAAANTVVEIAATDVLRAAMRELSAGMPISGALKSANSALVKARVAGELQGLTVREGDAVKAGQTIAKIDVAEYQARVTQAQRSADAAKAQIDIAQRQFDNNRNLVDQGFISKTALDTSAASLEAARATYQSALAAVDITKKSVDDTVLRAPISGVISQRLAQNGERVGIDARVVEIIDLSRLEVEAQLASADAASVRVGQVAQLQIEGSAQTIAATVARINPSVMAGSRGVQMYLSLKSAAGLRQGMFVQGTLGTEQVQAIAVPLSTVRNDKPQPYVQVLEKSSVVYKAVTLGARGEFEGQAFVAIKELADGTLVLSASVGSLREGTAVKITASPAAAAATTTAGK